MNDKQLDHLLANIELTERVGQNLEHCPHTPLGGHLSAASKLATQLHKILVKEASRDSDALLRELIVRLEGIAELRYLLSEIWTASNGRHCPDHHNPYYGGKPCGLCTEMEGTKQ